MKKFLSTKILVLFTMLSLAACASPVAAGQLNSGQPEDTALDIPFDSTILDREEATSIRVLWAVEEYVPGQGFRMIEASQNKRHLSGDLEFKDNKILFEGKTCEPVVIKEETLNADDDLAQRLNEPLQNLGLDTASVVQVITTKCEMFGFQELARLADGRLIVPFEGTLYLFTSLVN